MKKIWSWFSQIDRKTLRIVLFCLAGALLAAAAVIYAVLYSEGVTAGNNAQAVLDASGLQASGASAGTADAGTPSNSMESAPPTMLTTELQGYTVIGRIDIDRIDMHLPVLEECTEAALKVSACYLQGSMPGEEGNMVVTGHNYANGSIFGKLDKLKVGDTVQLTGQDGSAQIYTIYEIDHITPNQPEKLSETEYARELTLLTCESHGNGRLVVRCWAES
jgi:LPXTG-site transpeptidase (sortase) family protein